MAPGGGSIHLAASSLKFFQGVDWLRNTGQFFPGRGKDLPGFVAINVGSRSAPLISAVTHHHDPSPHPPIRTMARPGHSALEW
ncbi:MAG: hypothetical protein TH68_07590 [Candidatus Synechococcus spongiarum 142]|uniref:Uncharacterized protein n=1 Tax=Candidatus Synechococcus spongiarum 142 TaxID=1608213 RepID=A0A6N3WZ97_9SYNE|nr:MAG: hypothetical protein TH68_07590 [Candidatus Synechococcus spongiarum 142]